jgi:alkanesulfonate monooxygenase SsuD/methylene tetrahydromethanopterin reductase-like flavin-dependent oxidoreductase (luciferase family)
MRIAHVEKNGDSARSTVREDIMMRHRGYWGRWGANKFTGLQDNYDYDELLKDRMLVGSPDEVIAQIETLRRIGVNLLLLRFRQSRMKHQQVIDSIRLFHSKVLPYFSDQG